MKDGGAPPLALDPRGVAARVLTVLRVLAIGPFVALLVAAHAGSVGARVALAVAFAAVAASDWIDGRLARAAGSATPLWGLADVSADAAFNAGALGAAAALGLIGPQAAFGVVLLAGVYLARAPALRGGPRRAAHDPLGHAAGVSFYALSGLVAGHVAVGIPALGALALAADAVFAYTLLVLLVRAVCAGKSSA